jgi:hypothetical protein
MLIHQGGMVRGTRAEFEAEIEASRQHGAAIGEAMVADAFDRLRAAQNAETPLSVGLKARDYVAEKRKAGQRCSFTDAVLAVMPKGFEERA